jgi:hypothetical protein
MDSIKMDIDCLGVLIFNGARGLSPLSMLYGKNKRNI